MVSYLKYRQPCRQPGCQLVALTRVPFSFCQTFCFLFTLQVASYDSAWTPDFSGITEGCWIRFLEKKDGGWRFLDSSGPTLTHPESRWPRVPALSPLLFSFFFFCTRVNALRSRCENSFTMLKALVNDDRIHLLRKRMDKLEHLSAVSQRAIETQLGSTTLNIYTSWGGFFEPHSSITTCPDSFGLVLMATPALILQIIVRGWRRGQRQQS